MNCFQRAIRNRVFKCGAWILQLPTRPKLSVKCREIGAPKSVWSGSGGLRLLRYATKGRPKSGQHDARATPAKLMGRARQFDSHRLPCQKQQLGDCNQLSRAWDGALPRVLRSLEELEDSQTHPRTAVHVQRAMLPRRLELGLVLLGFAWSAAGEGVVSAAACTLPNCTTCSSTGQACTACKAGFFVKSGRCLPCSSALANCTLCNQAGTVSASRPPPAINASNQAPTCRRFCCDCVELPPGPPLAASWRGM